MSAYADTLVLDHDQNGSIISAIRFGGYPEMVRAMADAIYGGATIEAAQNDTTRMLQSSLKSYQRQITHDGIYAVATLMAADTVQEDDRSGKHEKDEDTNLVDDLSRALTSELAMLAVPETLPLFLRKYQHRQIKQYRRREPVYKGAGDIICCLDESGSTAGDLAAWGKAVALTLLEIAQSEGRKFALVHFSGPGRFQTDVFLPGQSSLEEKLHAAETFLGGGTDFQTPLAEAERLMREGGFENADIAFITDGECSLPETCVEMLQKAQSELRFTVTGILLDEGNAGMDFSLKPFCQNIYRTSELTGDQIVGEIVLDRV